MNEYIIIYGHDENTLNILKNNNNKDNIILIEPFVKNIDHLDNLKKRYNFKIVKKLLITDDKLLEINVYEKNENNETHYFLNKIDNYTKKHNVFTTSLSNIIKEYEINSIKKIYVNIDISNLRLLLDKWCSFNYLIEKINIPLLLNDKLMNNLFFTFYEENISLDENTFLDFHYMHYKHKNLKLKNTKILLYNIDDKKERNNIIKYDKFLEKNNIINVDYENKNETKKQFLYDIILYNLDQIFNNYKEMEYIDIIIQFNSKYYNKNEHFQINYQINDALLYIDKEYDIIYSTKNCMHMLYEVLKSTYFEEYINEQKNKKGKIFKFFSKRLFYEYIQRIFKIVEI